ncbi:MAG: sigma-70 family RNA polymerase sigma factor [Planctomycetes bacterium]|nr:sigma-70 family RNA polymerase sigma factor [Planctomycetota bacterium]
MTDARSNLDETLQLLRAAVGGDSAGTTRLVERFTPLLLEQARQRLGPNLRRHHAPEDLVQDVWGIALPRLSNLIDRHGDGPIPVLPFLGRILLYHVNNLVRKHIVGKPKKLTWAGSSKGSWSRLTAQQTGAITNALRSERRDLVREALERLPEIDRQLLVWRGMENHAVQEIAVVLGRTENYVSVRYRRALERLRRELRGSAFDDFAPDTSR